eukprot:CAMPEP_0175623178 /NCGR_PEP_ID=MMETSP0096-20121207/69301_1 /TAXON_ID=311494 /ORGANISM="Alexandrium monilatum, Strain CCMP3105" /LENGTH=88 /DNA_ID=CAMNT_0016928439 /DNA_START=46 /DNA_END=309 /DNA_ORIENTATION=+
MNSWAQHVLSVALHRPADRRRAAAGRPFKDVPQQAKLFRVGDLQGDRGRRARRAARPRRGVSAREPRELLRQGREGIPRLIPDVQAPR